MHRNRTSSETRVGLFLVFTLALVAGLTIVPGPGRPEVPPVKSGETVPNHPVFHPFRSDATAESRKQLALRASTADGKPVFTLPGFCEAAWSPRGDSFACNIHEAVLLGDGAGHTQTLVTAEADSKYFWTPAWAPDGKRLALLSVKRQELVPGRCFKFNGETVCEEPEGSPWQWTLQIFDTSTKHQISRFPLREENGTEVPILGGWPFTMIAMDKFSWSPDGRQILVSWGYASLLNVETGDSRLLSPKPMMVDWDREGRLWALEISMQPSPVLAGLFVIDPATLQRREVASRSQIEAEHLTFSVSMARLAISPSGGRMILAASRTGEKPPDVIRIYDITKQDRFDIRAPLEAINSDPVLQLDWSPDSKQVVVSRAVKEGTSGAIATDVIDLGSHGQTRLSTVRTQDPGEIEAIAFEKHLSWAQ